MTNLTFKPKFGWEEWPEEKINLLVMGEGVKKGTFSRLLNCL